MHLCCGVRHVDSACASGVFRCSVRLYRMQVVAVNHTGGVKQAAHLLKYDSVLGTYEGSVETTDDETMTVDGKPVRVCGSRDPTELPWGQLGVDIVIEGTGVFVDSAGAGKHIQAGAKRVLITAPAKGDDIPTYVVGVNERGTHGCTCCILQCYTHRDIAWC